MRQRTQRGLAIVEAAPSLPVLTLLLLPVVEIGRAFVQYSELSHRVRAATRHVAEHALDGTTGVPVIDAALRAEAINLVVYGSSVANGTTTIPGLSTAEVDVTLRADGQVRVSVSHPYQSLVGGILPGVGFGPNVSTAITMLADATMRPL